MPLFDYQMIATARNALVKCLILVNDGTVDALIPRTMVHRTVPKCGACDVEKLKDLDPRHMFLRSYSSAHRRKGDCARNPERRCARM